MTDLRPATPDDAPVCGKILQDWLDQTTWMPDLHSLQGTINFAQNQLIGTYETTVSGTPVDGFVSLEPDGQIAALYVSNPGHGIGSALLNHAKIRERLSLWTFQANTGAIRFYARHGFKEIYQTDGANNEEKLPDIFMEWQA